MSNILNKRIAMILAIVVAISLFAIIYKYSNNNNIETGEGNITVDFGFQDEIINKDYGVGSNKSPVYRDSKNRFSFNYPEGYSLGNFFDDIGETILIQRKEESIGFQIYITHFDEPGRNLTPERIEEELPDVSLGNPVPVYLNDELLGISFVKADDIGEKSREIWIAKNGFLYQMTTYQREQGLLKEILETWKFLDN